MDLLSKQLYYNMKTIKDNLNTIHNWHLHFCSQSFSSTDLELGFEGGAGGYRILNNRILKVNKLLL